MPSWRISRLVAVTSLALFGATSAAVALTIASSANPADGWRSIAPVGNLEGQPLDAVGLAWETDHVGWNTSISFDDSDAAGWHVPVVRDVAQYGYTTTNSIWADDPQGAGDTPAYFRRVFTVDFEIGSALFGGHDFPSDASNLIDDDAQIYLNGVLVYDDRDGEANFIPITDVAAFLHTGQNLLAVKAHDSFAVDEHFSLELQIQPVPEPSPALLVALGLAALGARRRRRSR